MAGRTRYSLPLSPTLERKFAALRAKLDVHVLAAAAPGNRRLDARFRLDRTLHSRRAIVLPPLAVSGARSYDGCGPTPCSCRSQKPRSPSSDGVWRGRHRSDPRPARRSEPPLDSSLRLRRLLARTNRRARPHSYRRRATLSPLHDGNSAQAGCRAGRRVPAFMDLETFLERPRHHCPTGRACSSSACSSATRQSRSWKTPGAWQHNGSRRHRCTWSAGERSPGCRSGSSRSFPVVFTGHPRLPAAEVAAALDKATALLLPSRSEGLPRIVVEALCRTPRDRRARAASPTSWWTTGTASSSRSGMRGRWPMRSCAW